MPESVVVDPILDLLGKMESQISRMETPASAEKRSSTPINTGETQDFRTLKEQLEQTEQRAATQLLLFTEALAKLRIQIPELVEDAIASRFLDVEERFYTQVREIQGSAMESFLQTSQARVGTRIAGLELTLAEQSAGMAEMRENTVKSDRNIDRLLQGLDRLTAELMRLATLAGVPVVSRRVAQLTPVPPPIFGSSPPPLNVEPRPVFSGPPAEGRRAALEDFAEAEPDTAGQKKTSRPSAFLIPVLVAVLVIGLGYVAWRIVAGGGLHLPRKEAASAASAPSTAETQLRTAADFAAAKDYAKAENIYHEVLRREPENRTAIKELASVLFKQQKYEEAANVLKTLPTGN